MALSRGVLFELVFLSVGWFLCLNSSKVIGSIQSIKNCLRNMAVFDPAQT